MAYVLDYTGPRGDYDAMKAAGVVGIIRYLSVTPWKNISRTEADAIRANGLELALVWETTATMTNGGRTQGEIDGAAAATEAESVGYPAGHVIYWAVDQDATSAVINSAIDYGRGFASKCSYVSRPYGNDHLIDAVVAAGVADKGWQCRAWSGTPIRYSPNRVLFQRADNPTPFTGVDVNDVNGPDWASTNAPPEDIVTPADIEAIAARVRDYLANPDVNPGTVVAKNITDTLADVQTVTHDIQTKVTNLPSTGGVLVDSAAILTALKTLPTDVVAAIKDAL